MPFLDKITLGQVALLGFMVSVVGLYLLWQARSEALYWMQKFSRTLRGEFSRRSGLAHQEPSGSSRNNSKDAGPSDAHRGTLRLVSGFGLIFLGQILLLLAIAL